MKHWISILFWLAGGAAAVQAQPSPLGMRPGEVFVPPPKTKVPEQLRDVGIEQRLGNQLPMYGVFRDETGRAIRLREVLHDRPAVLAFVYYECPMLCGMVLNATLRAARALDMTAGRDFDIIAVSFNPDDTPQLAAQKKATYLEHYRRPGSESGWHFLTGSEDEIRSLTEAAGFHYRRDPQTKQFAHASGILVVTPEGKVARYFYGLDYSAQDLKVALQGATRERISAPAEKVLLYCFHYDPATGRYSLEVLKAIRAGGIATVGVLLLGVAFMSWRANRREPPEAV